MESVRAYTDCVELTFSQYMDATDASLAELAATGLGEGCTFEWVGPEEGADGRQVAKALRIKPAKALEAGSTVEVSLAGAVNYAGIPMDGWNSGQLTVGARAAELKLNVEQGYSLVTGQSCEVSAYVRDASGQPPAGQLVVANVGSSVVAGLGSELGMASAVTDADGVARFTLSGEAPGMTDLTVTVADSLLAKTVDVRVADEQTRPARPTAQLGEAKFGPGSPKENFATVKKGAQLVLSAEEGTTVYYTADDTCPCVDGGSRVEYTGPVTVNENTRFRIAAFKEGLENEYSERLNITVTVTEGDEPGGEPGGPGGGDGPQGPGGDEGAGGAGTGEGAGTGAGDGSDNAGGNADQPAPSGMQAGKPASAASAATGDTPCAIAPLALGAFRMRLGGLRMIVCPSLNPQMLCNKSGGIGGMLAGEVRCSKLVDFKRRQGSPTARL